MGPDPTSVIISSGLPSLQVIVNSPYSALMHDMATAAIARSLPTDILEPIFIHCACEYHDTDIIEFDFTAPSWVNVSYVNRHWRTVALNCPTLWTYIFITSPRWTEELLARSKQAPLKLFVDVQCLCKPWVARCVEQLLGHLERIQKLRLYLRKSFENHHVISRLSSCAPCLQSLEISVQRWTTSGPNDSLALDALLEQWSLLPPFGGNTPSLHTLVLSSCPVPWNAFQLSGLKTLILKEVPIEFQQDTAEFLATTLSCMQNITYLHLDDALVGANDFLRSTAFDTFQKIDLPCLSRLLLSAPLSTTTALLSWINIPLKAEIKLELCGDEDGYGSSLDHFDPLCRLLAQIYGTAEASDQVQHSWTIRSLGIASGAGDDDIGIIFTTSECKQSLFCNVLRFEWDCTIPLQITLFFGHYSMTRSDMERITGNICSSVPLSNVRTLSVFDPPHSPAFWMDTLGRLQGLRYLTLSEGSMPPTLASILATTPNDGAEGGHQKQVLVPELEELELCLIRFSGMDMDGDDSEDEDEDQFEAGDEQSLRDALATRKDRPVRLTFTRALAGCFECAYFYQQHSGASNPSDSVECRCCVVM